MDSCLESFLKSFPSFSAPIFWNCILYPQHFFPVGKRSAKHFSFKSLAFVDILHVFGHVRFQPIHIIFTYLYISLHFRFHHNEPM